MPKVNRKYYARAKEISDASINIVELNRDFFSINRTLISNNNTVSSLVLERDKLINMTYLNKKLDKNLSTHIVHSGYELENNDEKALGNKNNSDAENIDIFTNEDGAINRNFINNFECRENDNNFTSQLQGWAIRNRITYIALNELIAYKT